MASLQLDKDLCSEELIAIAVARTKGYVAHYDSFQEELEQDYHCHCVELSLFMLSLMDYFNSLVFNDSKVGTCIIPGRHPFIAGYDPDRDRYGVFIECMNYLTQTRSIRLFDYIDKNGVNQKHFIGIQENLIAIALHEVRHRLQIKKKVKMFTKDRNTTDQQVNMLIGHKREVFKRAKHKLSRENRQRKFVKTILSDKEFDAHIIEDLFLIEILKKGKISISHVKDILLLNPIRLFN